MGIKTRPVGVAKKVHINTKSPLHGEYAASDSEETNDSKKICIDLGRMRK